MDCCQPSAGAALLRRIGPGDSVDSFAVAFRLEIANDVPTGQGCVAVGTNRPPFYGACWPRRRTIGRRWGLSDI